MFRTKSAWDYTKVMFLDLYLQEHKGYIAGGCFKNIFQGEKIKDVDIFFKSSADQIEARVYFERNEDYVSYYDNDKVDAFKNTKTGIVVELVKSVFAKPEDMIKQFDFTITKFVYYNSLVMKYDEESDVEYEGIEKNVCFHEDFFDHLIQKRLVIDDEKLTNPANTLDRMFRYGKYGYFPCRMTKIKIIKLLQGVNPETINLSLYNGLD